MKIFIVKENIVLENGSQIKVFKNKLYFNRQNELYFLDLEATVFIVIK